MRSLYAAGVVLLSVLSLLFAAGIIYGEATGSSQTPAGWFLGGAMVGALLIAYSFIVLLLRKMGITGPRKAER